MIHQIINDDDDDDDDGPLSRCWRSVGSTLTTNVPSTSPAKWRRLLVINGGEPTSFNNGVCRTRCKAPLSSGNLNASGKLGEPRMEQVAKGLWSLHPWERSGSHALLPACGGDRHIIISATTAYAMEGLMSPTLKEADTLAGVHFTSRLFYKWEL